MFLTHLKLKGYTRIAQNSIDCIEIDFSKPMQIVLGSNGSGKSSLLEQLSLLPPVTSAEFVKGGFKEARADVNGDIWIAISDYGERNGHYLEKNGEVLNNWGTAQVQKLLLEEHLGLTQEIYDVQSNVKKFINMSPIERRDWVMKLSNIHIDPIMHKFMLAKNAQKDAKGYLKRTSDRLKIESRNLVSEQTLETLNTQLKELKDEFNFYSQFSEELSPIPNLDLETRSQELIDMMEWVMGIYPEIPSSIIKQGVKNPDQLRHLYTKKKTRLDVLQEQFNRGMNDLKEINKIAEAKAKLEEVGVDESIAKISQLETELNSYKEALQRFNYTLDTNPHTAKNDFLRIFTELKQHIFELPNNDGYRYNSQAMEEHKAKEHALANRIAQLNKDIYQKEHDVKHIDDAEDLNCPQCSYIFKKGVRPGDKERLTKELANYQQQLIALKAEHSEITKFIQECAVFIEQIRSIYRTMSLTPSNEGLWVEVRKCEIFKNPSFEAIGLLDQHLVYLDLACGHFDVLELYSKEQDIYKKALENQGIVNEANTKDIAKIDELVFGLGNEIDELSVELKTIDYCSKSIERAEQHIEKIGKMFDEFNNGYLIELDNNRANFIKDSKFNIMKEINSVEQELEQARVKTLIYKDIENEYEKAKAEYEDYTVIVDNLSPNTGLIADIMNDSINIFVENLNNVINAVWTTDLVVKPCINKKNDLDWKFPVEVSNGLTRPDISKTSTSQKDIINLGFQLMVSKADAPLYLDELGSSMDEQHRINMMQVLSELIDTEQCSQLFLVSHFAALHEQFNNSEIMILNTQNILNMPRTFNKHVTIS